MDITDQKETDRAIGLHYKSLVVDMHSDLQMDIVKRRGQGQTNVIANRHLSREKEAGGIDIVVLSTVSRFGFNPYQYYQTPTHSAMQMIDCIYSEIEENPEELMLITKAADIYKAKEQGKLGFILAMEGAEPLYTDLSLVRNFYRLGIREVQLTWHQRNLVSDGCAEPANAGLSNFGKDLVKELNRMNIIIDVAHMSRAGGMDVIKISEKPIMASHANTRKVCDHPRNLDDEQIKAIAKNGGLIGVMFLGQYVSKSNQILEDVMDHVDHIANLVGTDHLGLGPDWIDYAPEMILGAHDVDGGILEGGSPLTVFAKDLENVTKLPNFTKGLISRGYSDEDIQKILGTNFVKFWESVTGE
jgi:membrane dipeptidase